MNEVAIYHGHKCRAMRVAQAAPSNPVAIPCRCGGYLLSPLPVDPVAAERILPAWDRPGKDWIDRMWARGKKFNQPVEFTATFVWS